MNRLPAFGYVIDNLMDDSDACYQHKCDLDRSILYVDGVVPMIGRLLLLH
jgi:hypothetical protein